MYLLYNLCFHIHVMVSCVLWLSVLWIQMCLLSLFLKLIVLNVFSDCCLTTFLQSIHYSYFCWQFTQLIFSSHFCLQFQQRCCDKLVFDDVHYVRVCYMCICYVTWDIIQQIYAVIYAVTKYTLNLGRSIFSLDVGWQMILFKKNYHHSFLYCLHCSLFVNVFQTWQFATFSHSRW